MAGINPRGILRMSLTQALRVSCMQETTVTNTPIKGREGSSVPSFTQQFDQDRLGIQSLLQGLLLYSIRWLFNIKCTSSPWSRHRHQVSPLPGKRSPQWATVMLILVPFLTWPPWILLSFQSIGPDLNGLGGLGRAGNAFPCPDYFIAWQLKHSPWKWKMQI